MTDRELAVEIVHRLNKLMEPVDDTEEAKKMADSVRRDIGRLLETRIACSNATSTHPTIQCVTDPADPTHFLFGALGLITAISGTIPEGPRKGWGHIAAEFDDDGTTFLRFCITKGALSYFY